MDFNTLYESVLAIFFQPAYRAVIDIGAIAGWIALDAVLITGGLKLVYYYKMYRYTSTWEFVLLAIDVPPENVQTPKAVEQLFVHIYNVMEPPSIGYKYRRGFLQFPFSFEIISIGGYIQFLIRTLVQYRDVVEAAVYAQYPDAEVTEVEDYVDSIPNQYPNPTHNVFAIDYILQEHWAYPIRTYEEFEHSISKDTILKDPMGTLLESFTRIGPGEQLWLQFIVEPVREADWKDEVMKKVNKIIGAKAKEKGGMLQSAVDMLSSGLGTAYTEISSQILGGAEAEATFKKKDEGPPNLMLYLTPGTKRVLEEMENKIRKHGFYTKIRLVYSAPHDRYFPSRCVNSVTGALSQFSIPTSNIIRAKYLTSTQYMFAERRKNYRRRLLVSGYKQRDMYVGKRPYIFNIEELATLWHFPMSFVKTPLLQKAGVKRAEPPAGLPTEEEPIESAEKESPTPEPSTYGTDAGPAYEAGQKFG
ncbi:MAG: hypothetical protein A3C90_01105 [Candidatus Magasanikbacteria bacterium RIFCSPHIGHO2_02_FULL_51_14]|uniref:DUF8128 domain-containing protein n=1 Tax=Candidatus Magasanikbacteria bacterium RIFCSPHIGHO2_02_FULL_51_14 TaxID=1798683 RepID=A0A1F6MFA1_9BACT|nr:MAG: hypothetical protein A3C90_01105 [Candidatus Magasanikbacteria bacterium RIFCSPHIGHO2_02_FULL_51_14]